MDRGAVHRAVLHTDSEVCVLQIRKNALLERLLCWHSCLLRVLPHCTEITEVEKRTRFGAVGENHRRDRRTDFFECLHQCHWPGHQEKHTPPLALHLEVCTQPGSLYPFCDFCAMR